MAFNRFMSRSPMQFSFYKEPLDVLSQALQVRQQSYDKNAALADQLLSMSINAMDADRGRANALTRGYQQTIDQLSTKYDGDYSRMSKELMGLARQVRKDFTSGGEAFAIEYNKGQYDKWLDFSQKAALSGRGPSVQQVNLGNQYALNTYKGAQFNADTGTFSSFNAPQLVEYQELSDLVDKFATQVVAEKKASGAWTVDPDNIVWEKTSSGYQRVTPERIAVAVKEGLAGHQGWQAYANQMSLFGQPITDDVYNMQIHRAMNTFAYNWTESNQDIEVNPYALENAKNAAKAGAPVTGVLTGMRENEGRLPQEFDRADVKRRYLGYTSDANTGSNYDPSMVGGADRKGGKVPQVQTFDEYMSNAQVRMKYGTLGQNLYAALKNSDKFKGLSEDKKLDMFADKYDVAVKEFNRTQDYKLKLNTDAMKELDAMYINDNTIRQSKFTIIDRNTGKTTKDLTVGEIADVVDVKGIDMFRNDKKLFVDALANSRVEGIVTPSSGINYGLELTGSNAINDRYRIIMHDYDAKADAVGQNLLALYEPMYGQVKESNWVYTKSMGPYAVKTVYEPSFNADGDLLKSSPTVMVQRLAVDEQTGYPLQAADGSFQTEGSPIATGLTLRQIAEREYQANILGYQTIKAADTKH